MEQNLKSGLLNIQVLLYPIPMSRRNSLLKQNFDSSSSDEEDEFFFDVAYITHTHMLSGSAPKHGGSVVGHKVIDREREEGHWRLHQDYFSDEHKGQRRK